MKIIPILTQQNTSSIPFNEIVRFGQRTMLDTPLFAVSWIIGRFCNYKCSYCWPHARSDTPDYYPLEVYKHTIDEIKRQANENGFTQFHWSFSGGEPTAYKHLLELIKHVGNESIHMTTNLSPGIKWWEEWCTLSKDVRRRSITASYHSEFADENAFISKCKLLMEQGVYLTVNQVMVPEIFYELYERMSRLHSHGINITLKPQSDENAGSIVHGYTPEMIELMQTGFHQEVNGVEIFQVALYDSDNKEFLFDQAERFNAFGFNRFNGWKCNSGFQSIIIRSNEVKRSYSCHDEILGTLTDSFTIFKEPQLCTTPICISSADSKIPKSKI